MTGQRGMILVLAFEGWADAGDAASGAAKALRSGADFEVRHRFDAEQYIDYQFTRPRLVVREDARREIVWPEIVLRVNDETGIAVLDGPEPARSWPGFVRDVIEVVSALGIRRIVHLGAMLADVPHTRPVSVQTTSENAVLRAEHGIDRSLYDGPVGIGSILTRAAEEAGIPSLALWASIPHYVQNAPNPVGALALLDAAEVHTGTVADRSGLETEAEAWRASVASLTEDSGEMSDYVRLLERARDTVDSPAASGDAIAEEFERFLRAEPDDDAEDPDRDGDIPPPV